MRAANTGPEARSTAATLALVADAQTANPMAASEQTTSTGQWALGALAPPGNRPRRCATEQDRLGQMKEPTHGP
jgi:hypothetical protein